MGPSVSTRQETAGGAGRIEIELDGGPFGGPTGKRPTLFVIYVNDLAAGIGSECKLFADDCKIIASIRSPEDALRLQSDLDWVSTWCNTWRMSLNLSKCRVMHTGRNNANHEYSLSDCDGRRTAVTPTKKERDLGIILSSNLKWRDQVCSAASKSSRMLGMLRNTFVTRDARIWCRLYTTYIRPHLEYAVAVWNPYLQRDIEVLERVQHRATKVSRELKKMTYEDRCRQLKLTSLVERRIRGDMIQQFKISSGLEEVRWASNQIVVEGIAGRREQMRREIVRSCAQRFNFFTNRIVNNWNKLALETIEAKSTAGFKSRFDGAKVAT